LGFSGTIEQARWQAFDALVKNYRFIYRMSTAAVEIHRKIPQNTGSLA
jgi:hypothetical protein